VYSYNPATDSWTLESSMNVPKSNPATGLLGGIIAAGGMTNSNSDVTDNEIYRTSKNVWKTLADIPTARVAPCFGVIAGSFYVAGGGSAGYDTPVDVLEVYSVKTKAWTTLASIQQAVVEPASAVVGGRRYCIGGATSGYLFQGVPYGNVQIYQP
jgi:Kelch motif